ncbi:hypothetical protein ACFV3R_25595 [Streptomyces sp. NPDC059740]|uniref:hypothetical protein n=1 Tax=Streptomyces sp. NPDC059740 TaxID=3346926 RepID=UPI003663CF9F
MPGPTPAGTTPPTATVISLAAHRRGRLGEAPVQPSHDGTAPKPTARDYPSSQLLDLVQALFRKRERTLTDPRTAEAYLLALETVTILIDGAKASGGLGEAQHRLLRAYLEEARVIPDYLTGRHTS